MPIADVIRIAVWLWQRVFFQAIANIEVRTRPNVQSQGTYLFLFVDEEDDKAASLLPTGWSRHDEVRWRSWWSHPRTRNNKTRY